MGKHLGAWCFKVLLIAIPIVTGALIEVHKSGHDSLWLMVVAAAQSPEVLAGAVALNALICYYVLDLRAEIPPEHRVSGGGARILFITAFGAAVLCAIMYGARIQAADAAHAASVGQAATASSTNHAHVAASSGQVADAPTVDFPSLTGCVLALVAAVLGACLQVWAASVESQDTWTKEIGPAFKVSVQAVPLAAVRVRAALKIALAELPNER